MSPRESLRSIIDIAKDLASAAIVLTVWGAVERVGRAQVVEPDPSEAEMRSLPWQEACVLAIHGPLLHAWAEHVEESADDELAALVRGWKP
jgi:hypothetical protein